MRLRFTDITVSQLKNCGTYYDETTPAFGIAHAAALCCVGLAVILLMAPASR